MTLIEVVKTWHNYDQAEMTLDAGTGTVLRLCSFDMLTRSFLLVCLFYFVNEPYSHKYFGLNRL